MPDTVEAATQVEPTIDSTGMECITQDPREPAAPEFLEVCDNKPVHLVCSRFCPSECGGHLVCDPCFQLGSARGLVKQVGT